MANFRDCDKCGECDGRTSHVTVQENGLHVSDWYLCVDCRGQLLMVLDSMPRGRGRRTL